MAVVLLVRHGMTDATGKRLYGRSQGIRLSEEGRMQAKRVAERLAESPLDALYSSPLERCLETAEAIADACGLEILTLDDVTEIDYGTLTGRTFTAISRLKLWRQVHRAPSTVRFPGGETLVEAQRRQVEAIESLTERHPRHAVAVVSHGDPIRLALAHYAGLHIDLYHRLEVAPGSVSAIALGEHAPRILKVNDTGTLEELAGSRRGGGRG